MSFNQASNAMASALFNVLGEAAQFIHQTGTIDNIQVIINDDVQAMPGTFESQYDERYTEAEFLRSDIPKDYKGEKIITSTNAYQIVNLIRDDQYVIGYRVKKI